MPTGSRPAAQDVKGVLEPYDESDFRSIQIVLPGRAASKQVTAKKNRQVSLAESERVWQSSVDPRQAQYRRPARIKQAPSDHPLNRKLRHGFKSPTAGVPRTWMPGQRGQ
jgi:hypothetical protein